MNNLFEYRNKIKFQDSFEGLESFLDEIWNNRDKNSFFRNNDEDTIESQRFIQFIHKTSELKSNKYVGVIHYKGQRINLLPKIFYDSEKEYSDNHIYQIHNHILWWLSYCRKIKFPSYQTTLGNKESDFFEVLIYLFSKYTRKLLNSSIYQQYQEVNRELSYIKGRLNTTGYINENVSRGNWHKLNCTYDAFVIDNEFNRIIKYVTTLLFNVATRQENKKNLREILFILDEVTDERVTAEQCSRISFNPMFGEFETVRDYCHLFLSNSVSFDYKNDLKLFAFLLPMEYVFEDFIFGFIDKELPDISVKAQRGDTFLDIDKTFKIKPDLWIETEDLSLIADAKYKIIYEDNSDPKKGISQPDLYQMLAYAVRFKVCNIILFYPSTVIQDQEEETEIIIKDTLALEKEVKIKVHQLPIINIPLLETKISSNVDIKELFKPTRDNLANKIRSILTQICNKQSIDSN